MPFKANYDDTEQEQVGFQNRLRYIVEKGRSYLTKNSKFAEFDAAYDCMRIILQSSWVTRKYSDGSVLNTFVCIKVLDYWIKYMCVRVCVFKK